MMMEIIQIRIEFPGGLEITDEATWDAQAGVIHISERLRKINEQLGVTEAPPVVSAVCGGREVMAHALPEGDFKVASGSLPTHDRKGFIAEHVERVRSLSKDQRQQFGRYVHTVSAAATIGAVGFWHSTAQWSLSNDFSMGSLCFAAVILFYIGIISMDGE